MLLVIVAGPGLAPRVRPRRRLLLFFRLRFLVGVKAGADDDRVGADASFAAAVA